MVSMHAHRASSPDLVWLHAARAERALVGGKGASLSDLAALGAPVPPAFALTTEVYAEFARTLRLPISASVVADHELPALRSAIRAATLPDSIRNTIAQGFRELHEDAGLGRGLAVRSSATAEDSAECSFAGLHDTVLDVRDLPQLERAVKQCWASLWSERAVHYRRTGGFDADSSQIAVVVQQLVKSDVSFVVFTVDPVSGHDQHLVIAATWGLGEAVVSGLVVPDHIVVTSDGAVFEYTVGDKHLMIIPAADASGGVREVAVPRVLRGQPVMTLSQAEEIAAMARRLSTQLGFPGDFEGAICDGAIYLLQARPITTLNLNRK
jgi:rifampicin phosphotransferase